MANNTSGWVLVDDRDPAIAYGVPTGGTLWHGGVAEEYEQTTTGLALGDTLTYYFNASAIAVFGTYGPSVGEGAAIFQVDDVPATTFTAPVTQTRHYRQNFWTSGSDLPSLAPGAFHTLFVNSTNPNTVLWVDYLAYPPTNPTATSSSSPTFPTSTTPTASTITSTAGAQPASTISNTKANTAAIVAGVVVGAVALILAIFALVHIRRRLTRPSVTEYPMPGKTGNSPHMSHNNDTLQTRSVTPHHSPTEDTPSYSSISPQECPLDQFPRPLPQVPGPVRTFDGGVRVTEGPLEIPPEYQEHY